MRKAIESSEYQKEESQRFAHLDFKELEPYIIYRCVIGSHAYGLAVEGSDVDRRGIYLPPADLQWSLQELPGDISRRAFQEQYWEIGKFIRLALKANPSILECLYSPMVEYASPLAEELLQIRGIFLSRLIYQTYNGYALAQFHKAQKNLEKSNEVRWKQAMHLIRILLVGIHILKYMDVNLDVGEYREKLLSIRDGQMPWEELDAWRLELHTQFDAAYSHTKLPEYGDYEAANAFLIKARRSMV